MSGRRPVPPLLFLDLDGPILVDVSPQPIHVARLGPGAKGFAHWAAANFRARWLTRRSPAEAFHAATRLALREDAIPYAGFRTFRYEAIPAGEPFVWIAGQLGPEERAWAEAARHGRVFVVGPPHGAGPALIRAVLSPAGPR